MSLDSIVAVNITTLTASISRAGFGTPLVAAYFPTTIFPGRVRTYTSLTGMLDDGFTAADPAYLMAQRLKSQNPSVTSWKVGRRALPPDQSWWLTPTITTEGEVLSITIQGTEISYTIPASATVGSIVTALTALIDAIDGVSASDASTHVVIAPNTYTSGRLTVDTADDSEDFTVTINGTSFVYSSDTDATTTEIRDGLKALIDAGSEPVQTESVSTNQLDITSDNHIGFSLAETAGGSGDMSLSSLVDAYEQLAIAGVGEGLTLKDKTTDPGLATDLGDIESEDAEWYGLLIDSNSEPEIAASAAWAEARKIIFGAHTMDSEVADANVTTDIGSDLKLAAYARTFLMFAYGSQEFSAAGWMGKMFPQDPGSQTWAYKKLAGVTVSSLSASQEAALNGKNVNHYQLLAGGYITRKGYSSSGEYIDITRGVDWFRARLQERFFFLLVNLGKLPFTDTTGDLIRSEILAQLAEGEAAGLIAPDTEDTPWVVDVPKASSISAADKALRKWTGITFSATLQGAVHELSISGTLSL